MSDLEIFDNFCKSLDKSLLNNVSNSTKKILIRISKYSIANNIGDIYIAKKILESLEKKSIKIVSWNVNGLRANILGNEKWKKCGISNIYEIKPESNLGSIISEHDPDIFCFQETRCDKSIADCIKIPGYYQYWNYSTLEGARSGNRYSGVSIWSKIKPIKVDYTIPELYDNEGRIIVAEYENFILITTYSPNAGTNYEYRVNTWDKAIQKYLQSLTKNVIWSGDLNIVSMPIDTFFTDPESKRYDKARAESGTIAGYTPAERHNFHQILNNGFVDVQREFYPTKRDLYTWYNPKIPNFRLHNIGWRLDYFIVNNSFFKNVVNTGILLNSGINTRPFGSDHLAIMIEIDIN